jgi:hypothetical protein
MVCFWKQWFEASRSIQLSYGRAPETITEYQAIHSGRAA